jgi:predicted hydrocarbon binding protein
VNPKMAENGILAEMAYDAERGALCFQGVRYLLIRPETLASLQVELEEEIGPARAGEILYASGHTGGRLSGRNYKETFGLNEREAADFMCRMGGEIGWGRFRLVELDTQARRLVVEVVASPFAKSENGATSAREAGSCHFIRGVLGGLASGLFETAVEAHEVCCLAQGDKLCRFEVHAPETPLSDE